MSANLNDIPRIAELLRFSTSRKVVQNFLRSKNLAHSSTSWDEFITKRIIQPVDDGELDVKDLLNLLASAEEFGKQHIFLYQCSAKAAAELLDPARLTPVLKKRGLESLIEAPLALDTPEVATIVEIRIEAAKVPLSLTIKEVYAHEALKQTGIARDGDSLTKTWKVVRTRAVNVAKLHRDGLLELRLASVSESSYKEQLERFIRQLGDIIPVQMFDTVDFSSAKAKLCDEKDALSDKIRFADTILRNEFGTTFRVASGSRDDDLAQDEGARAGEGAFLGHNGAYPDGHNFFFREVPDELSKEMLILMSGEANEFGVMANCDESDYNYVLRELRSLNN